MRHDCVRLLTIALPLSFVWEMLQAPAFTGLPRPWFAHAAVCAIAAAGDALLVLALFALWLAVDRFGLWGYAARHPTLPLTGTGLLPILYAVIVVPLAFWLLAWWHRKGAPQ